MMADKDKQSGSDKKDDSASRWRTPSWIAFAILAMVGYQIYNGVYLKEVGFPPFVSLKFGDPPEATDKSAKSEETGTKKEKPEGEEKALDRSFIVGRWQTSVQVGNSGGDSATEYFDDGSFSSTTSEFFGTVGQRQQFGGTWDMEILSDERFRLTMWDEEGDQWQGIFRVLNRDEVQNMDQNYIATRVGR